MKKNRVLLGLSGGVDSTAAVLILQERGFHVTGLFFDVMKDTNPEYSRAREVADTLGIELIYRNESRAFDETVISDFSREYSRGRTPNPCIVCNPHIKFRVLAEEADSQNIPYIATGHYANVGFNSEFGMNMIKKGKNIKKDQSYMLYRLPSSILNRLILPLGEINSKEDVRKYVGLANMPNANKKDSQDICFVDGDYIDYLKGRGVQGKPGDFVDGEGNVVGQHLGIFKYTVGQRKGLRLALGYPAYVTEIDCEANTVKVGKSDELLKREIDIEHCYFPQSNGEAIPSQYLPLEFQGRIRYSSPFSPCKVKEERGFCRVTFLDHQSGPAPGQSLVLYRNDFVVGGGIIK